MFPNKKPFLRRLALAIRITAILFLFVCVCFAAAAHDTAHKQPVKGKSAVFTVSLKDSVKGKQASGRTGVPRSDTVPAARDTSRSSKGTMRSADTAAPKAAVRKEDTGVVGAVRAVVDTAKKTGFVAHDSGAAMPWKTRQAVDSTVARNKQTMSRSYPAAPLRAGTTLLFRLLVLLVSVAIILAAVVVVKRYRDRVPGRRFLTTTRLSVMDKEVQRACRYIEQHFADPGLTPKTVCDALVTGEAFLEALMDRDLGISVSEFIMHVRVNGAKKILEKDAAASKESVASATGFGDPGSFETAFKKVTGVEFEVYARQSPA
jgi:AraC-like DNA-binding protein